MLESCFTAPQNPRKGTPKATPVTALRPGSRFEARAFTAIWHHRARLKVAELFKCYAARVDGFLRTSDGEIILLEMKESLSWGSTEAAGFQFLAGRSLLAHLFNVVPTRGIIVYERTAEQWDKSGQYGALGQLALEASNVSGHIVIGALRLDPSGSLHTFSHSTA